MQIVDISKCLSTKDIFLKTSVCNNLFTSLVWLPFLSSDPSILLFLSPHGELSPGEEIRAVLIYREQSKCDAPALVSWAAAYELTCWVKATRFPFNNSLLSLCLFPSSSLSSGTVPLCLSSWRCSWARAQAFLWGPCTASAFG